MTARIATPLETFAGRVAAAERGNHMGPTPYGYRRPAWRKRKPLPIVIHPDEAEIVRLIFRRFLARKRIGRVRLELAKAGILTRAGAPWTRSALEAILRNVTYVGRVSYAGEVDVRGRHEAIVAPIVFWKAGVLLRRGGRS